MPRTWLIFAAIFLVFSVTLFAQEEEQPENEDPDDPFVESDWFDYEASLYSPGDRNLSVSLGIVLPIYFSGAVENNDHGIGLGGIFTFRFNFFLSSHFFVGGGLSFYFAGTRQGNLLYMIPFGLQAGYQLVIRRFEFPLSLLIGAAFQGKQEQRYFGFIVVPSAGAFWRFNPDWSFGINGSWWFVPQRPRDGNNVNGNFLELTLSARYHL